MQLVSMPTRDCLLNRVLCMLSRFSCVQLLRPMDYSLPGSSVHEISQARILEWVAISFSIHLAYLSIYVPFYEAVIESLGAAHLTG